MTPLLAVALGGALGALARYGLNGLCFALVGARFPAGTLVANLFGCAAMGALYVLVIERGALPPPTRELLMVGFLGSFTTFSAFSLDALALWQNGGLAPALGYVAASVLGGLLSLAAAVHLARLL
ncbi:MAG: hypothetical protein KatS3mg124_1271 [Porticoccaceae bacterium]|nr:MAG: hypothetical protein KatS3mg124_1271 [Porticoccaceae bacterium]